MNMTDDQAKVVSRLRDPYLKNHNGIIAAMVVDSVSDEVTRYIIHPDGNYHAEMLSVMDSQGTVWDAIYSTLGCDDVGGWIETNTLEATYYDRLTINELLQALQDIPQEERNLPIYAYQDDQCVPLMKPTLWDSEEPHSDDNPLSMTLDWKD